MTSRLRLAAATVGVSAALLVAVPGMAFAAETPDPAPPVSTVAPVPGTQSAPLSSVAPVPGGEPTSGPTESRAPSTVASGVPPTTTGPKPVTPGQVSPVPVGAADTGDGSTAPGQTGTLLLFGALGLTGAAGAGVLAASRRRARRT